VQILAIDEADKLFELNFEEQLNHILRSCPPSRQVLLFSATIPQQLAQFMKTGIREYKFIALDEESKIPDKLKIHMITCRSEEKKYYLLAILQEIINPNESTMIFVPTKYHCEFLNEFLKFWGIQTLFIYGQMDMELRTKNLERFRTRKCNICIVTDVAARGLDIPFLDNVINYDFPDTVKLFIHRVGRTARNNKEGRVISILAPNEVAFFFDFKPSLGRQLILKYSDENDKVNKDLVSKAIDDFGTISFGTIPTSIITNQKETKVDYLNNKIDIDLLEESATKAYNKSLLFKQKPSKYGIKQAKIVATSDIIHPFFVNLTENEDEIEKLNFLNQIKNFKPKESYFERVNETNVKDDVIKHFKTKAEEYKKKKELEKRKEKLLRLENDAQIDIEEELNNDNNNGTLKKDFLGKKVKRSQMRNFKNNPHYVTEKADKDKSLWGDEKPISLDELTLNIVPDDDNLQKRKKIVWDPKKKNFVKGNVDKSGKLVKTNESGKQIKKGDKNPQLFQKWKKKNQMKSIPKVGDLENDKIVNHASNIFRERKSSKRDGQKVKNEVKSFDQILKTKKDKFKQENRKHFSKRDAKERGIKDKAHLNRRSQAMIKRRGKGRGKRHK
jgi:ATP-dependent RNA helicase DDX54/DBP10